VWVCLCDHLETIERAKRIEVDHLEVVMESLHDRFARHPRREGCDGGEDGLF
jgi:hypothetical protein